MAKLGCVCGASITTSGGIPNVNQWNTMSDVDFDAYEGLVDVEELYRATTLMFRCPVSDHLWVYWDGLDSPPSLYGPVIYDSPNT